MSGYISRLNKKLNIPLLPFSLIIITMTIVQLYVYAYKIVNYAYYANYITLRYANYINYITLQDYI